MDPLTIALIVLAVLLLGGFGYGYYARPVPAATHTVVTEPAPAGYVTPLGLIGALVVIAVVAMLITGWRPFVVAT